MEYQPTRRISAEELKRCTFRETFDGPAEITPTLLAELYDCVFKFGIDSPDRSSRTIAVKEPIEMAIQVSPDPSVSTLLIWGPGGQMSEGCFIGLVSDDGMLWWDKRVSIEHTIIFLTLVDVKFEGWGWRDPVTGVRTRKQELVRTYSVKRSVEQTFQVAGSVMWVPPDKSTEELLAEFDHPELLAVVETPAGGPIICHIRDRKAVEERGRLADIAIRALGYDPSNPATLPTDVKVILAVREQIKEAIEGRKK